jgi:hypothetical protein
MAEKIVYRCNLNDEPTPAKCDHSFLSDIIDYTLCSNTSCPCVHREKYEITTFIRWDDVTNIKVEKKEGE